LNSNNVIWRKATYSGANGGECIEVGIWRKATHSGANGGDCVEVGAWRKTTHSGDSGGACVEVAPTDAAIAVRDSKDPAGPTLSFTPPAWHSFLTRAATRP
jgi:hypothetical protein